MNHARNEVLKGSAEQVPLTPAQREVGNMQRSRWQQFKALIGFGEAPLEQQKGPEYKHVGTYGLGNEHSVTLSSKDSEVEAGRAFTDMKAEFFIPQDPHDGKPVSRKLLLKQSDTPAYWQNGLPVVDRADRLVVLYNDYSALLGKLKARYDHEVKEYGKEEEQLRSEIRIMERKRVTGDRQDAVQHRLDWVVDKKTFSQEKLTKILGLEQKLDKMKVGKGKNAPNVLSYLTKAAHDIGEFRKIATSVALGTDQNEAHARADMRNMLEQWTSKADEMNGISAPDMDELLAVTETPSANDELEEVRME